MAEKNEGTIQDNNDQESKDVSFEEMEQASEYGTADFVKGAAAGAVVGSIVILT